MPEMLSENPMYRLEVRLRWRRRMFRFMPPAAGLVVVLTSLVAWCIAELEGTGPTTGLAIGAVGAVGALALLALAVAAEAAGCMVGERRRGSVDSLLLTSLSDYEILAGMFHACAIPSLLSLMVAGIAGVALVGPYPQRLAMLVGLVFVGLSGCYLGGAVGLLFGAHIRSTKYAAWPIALACTVTAVLTVPLSLFATGASMAAMEPGPPVPWGVGAAASCAQTFVSLALAPAAGAIALRGVRPR